MIQDFLSIVGYIKHYQKTSKNIFKNIVVRKKIKKLRGVLDEHFEKGIVIDKALLIEFISIYNGGYDLINIPGLYTQISGKIYSMKITSGEKVVTISTLDHEVLNDKIYIIYTVDGYDKRIIIDDSIEEKEGNNDNMLIKPMYDIVKQYIFLYMDEYINYIFNEKEEPK